MGRVQASLPSGDPGPDQEGLEELGGERCVWLEQSGQVSWSRVGRGSCFNGLINGEAGEGIHPSILPFISSVDATAFSVHQSP